MGRVFPNRAAYNRGSYGRPPPRLLTAFYARTPLQSLYNNSSMGKKPRNTWLRGRDWYPLGGGGSPQDDPSRGGYQAELAASLAMLCESR